MDSFDFRIRRDFFILIPCYYSWHWYVYVYRPLTMVVQFKQCFIDKSLAVPSIKVIVNNR